MNRTPPVGTDERDPLTQFPAETKGSIGLSMVHQPRLSLVLIILIKVAIWVILGNCKTRCTWDTSTVYMISVLIFSTLVLVLESPVGSWVAASLRVGA